ncbi:MAG: SDR family oxidoreductase [Oscillospiraceae bacterium]|nr:SDR family oxidoreductase [Oscillospiraceae bacterium]
MQLKEKIAIVTGAASGIGEAISKAFAREGAFVCMTDIDVENGTRIEKWIREQGHSAIFIEADAANTNDTEKVFAEVKNRHGDRLDILVNNVGMAFKATIVELTEEQWDRQVAVNMKSVYLYSHRAIPLMIKNGGGSVINTGSVTSLVGVPDFAAYVGTKCGMLGLTRAMALDHAKDNVRVNIVCPSGVRTALMDWQFSIAQDPQEEIRRVVDLHPIGRMADPEEVAELYVFLASEKGSYFTGTAFPMDGGYTAK